MPATKDVLDLVKEQHAHIRALFEQVQSAPTNAVKQVAFEELRRYLAVHEVAEELVIHPSARAGEGGDGVVDARLEEEDRAKEMLARLDDMDVAAEDFDILLVELRQAVTAHAEAEETRELPLLRSRCSERDLLRMAQALEAVEEVAPTHPHPRVGSSAMQQLMAGPLASVLDRTRDRVARVLGG